MPLRQIDDVLKRVFGYNDVEIVFRNGRNIGAAEVTWNYTRILPNVVSDVPITRFQYVTTIVIENVNDLTFLQIQS